LIPKEPNTPIFTIEQIKALTDIVFLEEKDPYPCDVIFVFAGTHSGHWEKAIEAYNRKMSSKFIVTGGFNPKVGIFESHVIVQHLVDAGVPVKDIIYEDKSSNTLENVLFAKEVFNFNTVNTILFICKSYGAGSQYRTIAQHLPEKIEFVKFSFDAKFNGIFVTRDNWYKTETGRKRVWGQYLRIVEYGKKGDLLPLKGQIEGFEKYFLSPS
jgi:hypothetical protein